MNTLLIIFIALAGVLISALSIFRRGWLIPLVLVYAVMPIRAWTDAAVSMPGFGQVVIDTLVAFVIIALLLVRILVSNGKHPGGLDRVSFILIFFGMAILSAIIVGMTGESAGFRMLIRLVFPLLVFYVVLLDYADRDRGMRLIDIFLVIGVLASAGVLVANLLGYSSWRWSAGVDRFSGLGSISDYSYLMGMLVVLSYVKFRVSNRKWLYLLLLFLFGAQLLMTVTRGGIFATALALIVLELFGGWRSYSARLVMLSILGISIVSAAVFYEPLRSRIFATHYSDVASESSDMASQLAASFTKSGREGLWAYVVDRVTRDYHLIFGYGLGNAEIDMTRDVGGVPHNEYMRIIYEMGSVGLIVFILSLFQIWVVARKRLARGNHSIDKIIALSCMGVLMLYASGAMVDNMINKYKNMGAPLYILLALALVSSNGTTKLQRAQSATHEKRFRQKRILSERLQG